MNSYCSRVLKLDENVDVDSILFVIAEVEREVSKL